MKGLFKWLVIALICYTEFRVEVRPRMKIRDLMMYGLMVRIASVGRNV